MQLRKTRSPSSVLAEVYANDTPQVHFSQNADQKHNPGSICKVITAMCCSDILSETKTPWTERHAVQRVDRPRGFYKLRSYLSVEDMLSASLLASHKTPTDMLARICAEKDPGGGTSEDPTALMPDKCNAKARKLGMKDTMIASVSGTAAYPQQYSTCLDLALLGQALVQHYAQILEVMGRAEHKLTMTDAQGTEIAQRRIGHRSKIVSFLRKGETSGKTGTMETNSQIEIMHYQGRHFVMCNLGSPCGTRDRFLDIVKMMKYVKVSLCK